MKIRKRKPQFTHPDGPVQPAAPDTEAFGAEWSWETVNSKPGLARIQVSSVMPMDPERPEGRSRLIVTLEFATRARARAQQLGYRSGAGHELTLDEVAELLVHSLARDDMLARGDVRKAVHRAFHTLHPGRKAARP